MRRGLSDVGISATGFAAELIGEGRAGTIGRPTRVAGGWCVRGSDNSAVLLDKRLRVRVRFAPPAGIDPTGESGHQCAVSRDGRWAAFAGHGHIAAVDVDGRSRLEMPGLAPRPTGAARALLTTLADQPPVLFQGPAVAAVADVKG